jgi:tRNA threonylcarbamoyladenosine biosynthesis protein TsaE
VLLGRAIGIALRPGDVVLLSGELGAGKTRMVQGMADGAGAPAPARSPTFVLVNEYSGRIRLSHCDLFRVSGPDEIEELALEERLVDGALAVEWPERGPRALPSDALLVGIDVDPQTDERTIMLTPGGERSGRLLSRASAIFEALDAAGPRPEARR